MQYTKPSIYIKTCTLLRLHGNYVTCDRGYRVICMGSPVPVVVLQVCMGSEQEMAMSREKKQVLLVSWTLIVVVWIAPCAGQGRLVQ